MATRQGVMKKTAAPAKPATYTVLTDKFGKEDMYGVLTITVNYRGKVLRAHVRSNSYANQSEAHADVWSPTENKWNRCAYLHYSLNPAATAWYESSGKFREVATTLLNEAIAILDATTPASA